MLLPRAGVLTTFPSSWANSSSLAADLVASTWSSYDKDRLLVPCASGMSSTHNCDISYFGYGT
jgi:hypothetical protein